MKFLKKNISLSPSVKVSNWRKTAVGTYANTGDCQVYSIQSINIEPALKMLSRRKELTLGHLAGKACATMIQEHPEINRLLRFGRFYPRKEISIFFQVAMDEKGADLSGHTVRNIDQMSLEEISEDMRKATSRMKAGDDFHYKKAKKTMGKAPSFLLRPLIGLYGFILYGLNLWSPLIGAPRDAFGSMMISNIGSLGMQTALVPLVPYSKCPLILALGAVYEKAVVENGEVVVRKCVDCCWTLDHRLIDGVIGAKMARGFQLLMENPERLEL